MAPGPVVLVEHPPVDVRVAELHGPGRNRAPLEVVLLPVDPLQLPWLLAAMLLAHEHLDLAGKAQEAGVEIARDPVPAGFGDALGSLCGVVALVLAEKHDLGAVILTPEKPGLVGFGERTPEVRAAVLPPLRFKTPAPIRVAPEAHQRALTLVPGAIFEAVGVARPRCHLGSDTEVAAVRLLAAAGRQLVDVVAQLLGGHTGAGVDHRQLAHPAGRGVEALPVQIPHDPPLSAIIESRDRVQAVDRQLAQSLNVGALATEALEQARGVRDGELMPCVLIGDLAVRWGVAVSELFGILLGRYRPRLRRPLRRSRQFSAKASARAPDHVPYRSMTVDGAGQSRSCSRRTFAATPSCVRSRPVS